MNTIPFKTIPAALRLPGTFAELDNSMANTSILNQRTLIIGQITSAGIATPNVPILSGGVGDAQIQGGINSILALMTAAYRLNDSFGEVWYLPLSDAASSVAAAGAITFTGSPSDPGTISLYIADQLVSVAVTAAQTVTAISTAVAAAINAVKTIPVIATASSGVVTITAVNKGLVGNDIDIRFNKQGTLGGESTPTSLTYSITAMSGGLLNPTLTTALGDLGDTSFDFIVSPYTDTTSMDAVKQLLNDQTGRWSWLSQKYGHVFTAYRGTFGAQTTFGLARNNQHETVMGFNDSPTLACVWAAAIAGQVAVSVRADPGVPLQYLPLVGVSAPPLNSQFTPDLRETMLFDGISTFRVNSDRTVIIENLITTYQFNAAGAADNSYLEVETLYQLMLEIRTLNLMLLSKYARVKLASNGSRPAANSGLITPNIIKADIIALYQEREAAGYVQNSAAFAAALVVNKNMVNPNRVDILWPGTPVNQMRTFATLVQFRLA